MFQRPYVHRSGCERRRAALIYCCIKHTPAEERDDYRGPDGDVVPPSNFPRGVVSGLLCLTLILAILRFPACFADRTIPLSSRHITEDTHPTRSDVLISNPTLPHPAPPPKNAIRPDRPLRHPLLHVLLPL